MAKAKKPAAKKLAAKPAAKVAAKSAKASAKPAAKAATKKSASKSKAPAKVAVKAVLKKAVKAVVKMAAKPAPKAAPKAAAQADVKKVQMVKSTKGLTRFNPLDDRIVLERVIAPEKTAGGLFIPDSAQEKPTVGKVVAVGRGHRDAKGRTRPCDVKVGDSVLFSAWSGTEIEVDGVTYVIMRETDLLGVTSV